MENSGAGTPAETDATKEKLLGLNDKKYAAHKLKTEDVSAKTAHPIPFGQYSVEDMNTQLHAMALLTGIKITSFDKAHMIDRFEFCISGYNMDIPFTMRFESKEENSTDIVSLRLESVESLALELRALNEAAAYDLSTIKCIREFSLLVQVVHERNEAIRALQRSYPSQVEYQPPSMIVLRNSAIKIEFRIKWTVAFKPYRNAKVLFQVKPHADVNVSKSLLDKTPAMFQQLLQIAEPQQALEIVADLLTLTV